MILMIFCLRFQEYDAVKEARESMCFFGIHVLVGLDFPSIMMLLNRIDNMVSLKTSEKKLVFLDE